MLTSISQLLENHFIHLQELRKTISSTAPSKSLYLYYVELYQVIRSVLQTCYKATTNLLSRAQYENEINARLTILILKLSRNKNVLVQTAGETGEDRGSGGVSEGGRGQ